MLCIEETGTKTCLMDTYFFRNPEEVSHLGSSQAHVVWLWFLFKILLIISFFQLKKHNKHTISLSFFFPPKQAVKTNHKTIKHWKYKQRDFNPEGDSYGWKPHQMSCIPALSLPIPEPEWAILEHSLLGVQQPRLFASVTQLLLWGHLPHPPLPCWDHQRQCCPCMGDTIQWQGHSCHAKNIF